MTNNEVLTACYAIGNRNSNDTAQVTQVRLAIRNAIGETSRKVRLPSHEVNVEQALTAGVGVGKSRYALASEDIDGNEITMVAFDTQTLRFASRRIGHGLDYLDASTLDRLYPTWLDSSYDTGAVNAIAFTANKLALHHPPSSSFVSSNPTLYYRGWRQIKRPSADGEDAGTGEVEWSADIDIDYEDWHEGILYGALKWVFAQARMHQEEGKYAEKFAMYLGQLAEMHPAEGFGIERLPQAPQFNEGGVVLTDTDYGNY